MPKRTDIKKIMIIGSGPIVIGQACEFDYSGTQACKALKAEGYKVVLVNSNPATIMTDPGMADATYIEPLTIESVAAIISRERPDALLPTMGGQTALNLAVALDREGILKMYGVELIGASPEAIKKAEDRELFKQTMLSVGLQVPKSKAVTSVAEGLAAVKEIGFPVILRPAFTLGGTGGGVAYNVEEFAVLLDRGLKLSPVSQVLIEQSVLGWKEYELEVVRDRADNVIIVCSIENFDPMGVHTGDSITVAPAQTLTDHEYQRMRDAAIAIIRAIGVDTGGSNIQFAINPENGEMVVIEMNPRVSRSSALASKATGFPIAKVAAKLAVGYTLDELSNDITRTTPASFEPTIDYVVTKIPRFTFEKFPEAEPVLTTQMKSVGEVMAIGRTFKESLHKAIRSLETGMYGFPVIRASNEEIERRLMVPNPDRLYYIAQALRNGYSVEKIYSLSKIDPWFIQQIYELVEFEKRLVAGDLTENVLTLAKELGFSDKQIATLTGWQEHEVRALRYKYGIKPQYKLVDTCAAEFEAYTPYLYSSYERPFFRVTSSGKIQACRDSEVPPTDKQKVIILGAGPNRIGQGIEFDYCCVHAVFALRELGIETVMINCNPETVSTDYDTADKLYFEPLTLEDVLHVVERENPLGVMVQFGGQTPLKLAVPLQQCGVKILGTSPESIDIAEDRKKFKELLDRLGLSQPESGTATSIDDALVVAEQLGYPVLVRPSYVLGGRAMQIVYDRDALVEFAEQAIKVAPEYPILIDKYLQDAIEVDVDALCDGTDVVIGGVMEHIEEAGIHSGDSACSLPPYSLPTEVVSEIKRQTRLLALALKVVGLINIQFAVKDKKVYVLEVNPRASRTVPFVSKATGLPMAKIAAKLMVGHTLRELGVVSDPQIQHVAVKEAVFPFDRFPGVDTVLGPEMKSTGEVMGIDADFGLAYAKAEIAANNPIPTKGTFFISVRDEDKPKIVTLARKLKELGFEIVATRGTASFLRANGVDVKSVDKLQEGRPNVLDYIKNRQIDFIVNTVGSARAKRDSMYIRRNALQYGIPYTTTIAGAYATVRAIESLRKRPFTTRPIQEYYVVS